MVEAGCEAYEYFKSLDKDAQKKACSTFRKDGRVIEIAGDYTETLARLKTSPSAVGVFGLSFYDMNRDKLRVATVNNVVPSEDSIEWYIPCISPIVLLRERRTLKIS